MGAPGGRLWGTMAIAAIVLVVLTFLCLGYSWFPLILRNDMSLPGGVLIGAAMLLLCALAWSGWNGFRATSPRVFGENFQFTYNHRDAVEPAGEWLWVKEGGVVSDRFMFSWPGMDGATLVHADAWHAMMNGNHYIPGVGVQVKADELWQEALDVARRAGIAPPYRLVVAPRHVQARGYDYMGRVVRAVKESSRLNHDSQALINTTTSLGYAVRELKANYELLAGEKKPGWWARLWMTKEDKQRQEADPANMLGKP